MISAATPSRSHEDDLLDQLVPPAGPRWRRWVAWLAFVAVVILTTWAFTSGTVTPRLGDTGVSSWGGDGPVQIGVRLTNRSRVAIEIVDGPRPRPGLRLLGYTRDFETSDYVPDPFPIRLEPDADLVLTAWFAVEDCEGLARTPTDDTKIDLQVRIANGPFSALTRTRSIGTDGGVFSDPDPAAASNPAWPVVMAQYACPAR